jgi:CRP/FNR family transcriptional regulator, cyclic AMP receptor protein
MAVVSSLDLLRRVPLFSHLTPEQMDGVADSLVKTRYKRGDMILKQGEKSRTLYLLLSGRARVIKRHKTGQEVILATMTQGDCVGEMSIIDDMPHSASLQAVVQTDVLSLSHSAYSQWLPEADSTALGIMCGLTRRLRRADRNVASLALVDVHGRVAKVLIESSVREPDGRRLISEKISRQDVANMVGASREMVSRVMGFLEEEGCIETLDTGAIQIHNRLARMA